MRPVYTREIRRLLMTSRPSFWRHPLLWMRYVRQSYL